MIKRKKLSVKGKAKVKLKSSSKSKVKKVPKRKLNKLLPKGRSPSGKSKNSKVRKLIRLARKR